MTTVMMNANNTALASGRTSRPVKKMERPKALRASGSGILFHSGEPGVASFTTAEEVVSFLDAFVNFYSNRAGEQDLQSLAITLCANLKAFGPQLESLYKDQLDRGFCHLRNASRDVRLDVLTRLHLLEVIELRASRWVLHNDPISYYQQKLSQVEDSQATLDYGHLSSSPTAMTQAPSPPPNTPLLLQSGEVLKSSGKYAAASKVPGKNFVKEEVVIRNSDSGKVNPGAKERLVQITGSSEDNIERARALMEETIRRNASPVRPAELPASPSFDQNNAPAVDFDENRNAGAKMNRSASLGETTGDKFLYTVNIGGQHIKITGNNLNLVQTAKLVLDEYFSAGSDQDRNLNEGSINSSDDGVVLSPQNSPRQPENAPSNREIRRTYSRDYLLLLGNSPFSKTVPEQFQSIASQFPDVARKDKERFNVEVYLKQYPDKFIAENIVVSAD